MSWSLWSVPGILASALAWVLALVVLRASIRDRVNRLLVVLLLVEGTYVFCAFVLVFLVESRSWAQASSVAAMALWAPIPFLYLRFLGISLDTAITAPFRSRVGGIVLWAAAIATAFWVVLSPEAWVREPYDPGWATWNFHTRPLANRFGYGRALVSVFGLVAALSTFVKAPVGSAARDRAKWFAIAFGSRDVYLFVVFSLRDLLRPIPFWGDFLYNPADGMVLALFIVLLSYGLLKAQLFDIDLRIKLTLERSTVISVIAAAFFVGSEVLESFIPVEGTVLGLLAAALVVAGLRPVHRFAERVAGAIMPGVKSTPEYVEAKKAEVYAATYELALADGVVSDGELDMLGTLRRQLGIPAPEAEAIERSVADRMGR